MEVDDFHALELMENEMNHPPQREMWYPGCMWHLAIIMAIITVVSYFAQ